MDKSKNFLFWMLSILSVVLVILGLASVDYVSKISSTSSVVSFTGEGTAVAIPDVAVVDFTILTEGKTSKIAQDSNSKKSKLVSDYLKKQGIEEKDIKTTSYNINPQYYYPPYPTTAEDSQPRITGYQVYQSYNVTIRDIVKVSEIMDGIVTSGVNNIYGLQFKVDKSEELEKEARAKAIDSAKEKAKELEKQVGIKLGRIVDFSENKYGQPYYGIENAYYRDGMGGGGNGPVFQPGENEIKTTVTLTYQIK